MNITLKYNTKCGSKKITYEVPESVLNFATYVLKLNGITDQNMIKEDIKDSFLELKDIQSKIKGIEKRNNTKVIVEVED